MYLHKKRYGPFVKNPRSGRPLNFQKLSLLVGPSAYAFG